MTDDDTMDRMVEAARNAMAAPRYCPCGRMWEPLREDYEREVAAVLRAALKAQAGDA